MTFLERLITTLATGVFHFRFRGLYILPAVHAMLAEVYPGETIPHVEDMIKKTSLTIIPGSPFLGDGLRPVMPKTLLTGEP